MQLQTLFLAHFIVQNAQKNLPLGFGGRYPKKPPKCPFPKIYLQRLTDHTMQHLFSNNKQRFGGLFAPLCALLLLFSNCETDFRTTADWTETTIAYGLLEVNKPVQYIRIQKAFLGEDINALDVATISDSLYLEEPTTAVIEEYTDANMNSLVKTIALTKTDAASEGIEKEEGIFAQNPYYLYKTSETLSPTRTYKLHIQTPRGNTVTAHTGLVADFNVFTPTADNKINLNGTDFEIRWKDATNGIVYDAYLNFHYSESRTDAPEPVEKTKLVPLFSGVTKQSTNSVTYQSNTKIFKYAMEVDRFLDLVINAFVNDVNDPAVFKRDLAKMDLVIYAGNEELQKFTSVSSAQLNVTASQNVLEYTNVENGLGVFASRLTKSVTDILLEPTSYQKFACSDKMLPLKFAVHPSSPNYPNCD